MSTAYDTYYKDYDAEFQLMVEECRADNKSLQCSATHALFAEEYVAIKDLCVVGSEVWYSAKRWGVAHSLYAALLAREGL